MLEQIVRPFQTPTTVPDQSAIVTQVIREPTQRAILTWGAVGQQPKPYSTGVSFTVKDPFKFEEYERFTTDVRVQNPDDPNQYVVEQRIDKISFKKTNPSLQVPQTDNSGVSGGTSTTTTAASGGSYGGGTVSDTTTETTTQPTNDEHDQFILKPPTS